jgi:hypothetical protein
MIALGPRPNAKVERLPISRHSLPCLCAIAALALALSAAAMAAQEPNAAAPPATVQQPDDPPAPAAAGGVIPQPGTPQSATPQAPPDKRIFGVLPNYRTADTSVPFQTLTWKQKFRIAEKDSFDWPVYPLSAAFACLYQLENSNPEFGQGLEGYAKRLVTSYGDQAIGNLMTEGLWPALLREDPRYFRRGTGSKKSRAWYAATRIFVTHTDAGNTRFNFSEVIGNSVATAISNAYYPGSRDLSDNLVKLATQLGTDSFSQVLKEFWPDVKRKLFKHHDD